MAEMDSASVSVSVQWSRLPSALLKMIADRLVTRVDNLRLRSVCSSWRSSVPPFRKSPNLPLRLPFPITPNPALHRKRRGQFSLTDSTIYFLQPPRQVSRCNTPERISPGWLLRVEDTEDGKMRPLNPLSKVLTERVPKEFPKALDLLNVRITEIGKAYSLQFVDLSENIERNYEEVRSMLVKKVVMSSSTDDGDDYAVMALIAGKLGFMKLGDKKWSTIDDPTQSRYDDIVHHSGQFYAVDYEGRAVVITPDLKAKKIASPLPGGGNFKQLISSCGDLFMIDKSLSPEQTMGYDAYMEFFMLDGVDPESPICLRVYKLNERNKMWEFVETLGDRVFFIADDCSYSVSSRDFAGLKGDFIYLSEDMFTGRNEEDGRLGEFCADTGVCNLKNDSCGPLALHPSHSKIFWPPPAWLKPKSPASKK